MKPEGITFSNDGTQIYVTAEEDGRVKLFKLPASPRHATKLPEALTSSGTITEKHVLPSGELFLSGNSLIDNSVYSIIDPSKPSERIIVSSSSDEGKAFGLSQKQVDEFWYTGAGDYKVHAWVVRPSNFDKNKKYPLAYLIHGGVSDSIFASELYNILIVDLATRCLERRMEHAMEPGSLCRTGVCCSYSEPDRKQWLWYGVARWHSRSMGWTTIYRPCQGIRVYRREPVSFQNILCSSTHVAQY